MNFLHLARALLPLSIIAAAAARSSAQDGLRIKLPFTRDRSYTCTQGNHGKLSHYDGVNDFAFDFATPEGTPVLACAAGRVILIKQDSTKGGLGADMRPFANYVWIDHGGGLYSAYEHLLASSVEVRPGELVNAGQVIAKSGNTGYSEGPHLHFALTDRLRKSIPARFLDVPGDGVPVEDQSYTSKNDGTGTSWFTADSEITLDQFAADGVTLTTRMLASFLPWDEPITLKGRVAAGVKQVAFFFARYGEDEAIVKTFAMAGADGSFEISIVLDNVGSSFSGPPFRYGLAPLTPEGRFSCKAMPNFTFNKPEVDEKKKPAVFLCLPFRVGETHAYKRIVSGSGEADERAVAIPMPEKSPVLSAGAGRVIAIGKESDRYASKSAPLRKTVYVSIDHGRGVITDCFGLAADSIAVHEGEIVHAGQKLGLSSKSVASNEPSLGFAVRTSGPSAARPMLSDLDEDMFVESEQATAHGTAAEKHLFVADSSLSGSWFEANGVKITSRVPATTYHADTRQAFEGEILNGSPEAAFVVRRRADKKVVATALATVKDKAFHLDLHVSDFDKSLSTGPWDYAWSATKEKKEFTSTRWLPLTLMR